ncbi:MAG: hypothetical protein WD055_03010 [Candidatus Dependentiae bacterium]
MFTRKMNSLFLSILCLSASAAFAVEEKKTDESSGNEQALIRKAAMCAGVVACIGGAIYLEKEYSLLSACWNNISNWWQNVKAEWVFKKEHVNALLTEHNNLVETIPDQMSRGDYIGAKIATYRVKDLQCKMHDILANSEIDGQYVTSASERWSNNLNTHLNFVERAWKITPNIKAKIIKLFS